MALRMVLTQKLTTTVPCPAQHTDLLLHAPHSTQLHTMCRKGRELRAPDGAMGVPAQCEEWQQLAFKGPFQLSDGFSSSSQQESSEEITQLLPTQISNSAACQIPTLESSRSKVDFCISNPPSSTFAHQLPQIVPREHLHTVGAHRV